MTSAMLDKNGKIKMEKQTFGKVANKFGHIAFL
jgi:hypothetical protein